MAITNEILNRGLWNSMCKCLQTMFRGSLSPRHGTSSFCCWRRRPPDVQGSCEFIE